MSQKQGDHWTAITTINSNIVYIKDDEFVSWFWNICRLSPSPIGPTQMTPLDMNLKFIFSVGTITALRAIEGFFSSMCWNMSFHVATFCHDFWAIRTGILSWPNNLWLILQQQREKKNFYFSKKKKRNFNTKHFFFQSIALFIPNSIHQADDYF